MKLSILTVALHGALSSHYGYLDEAAETETSGKTKKAAKPKITVQMTDGRSVEFPEDTKAKKSILLQGSDGNTYEKGTEVEGVTLGEPVGVRWDFSNGETRTVLLSDVQSLIPQFAVHGLSQKGGDEYASEKDVDDAVQAFDDLMDRLKKGEWSERREGGGFGGQSVLAKALAEVFQKSAEEVRAFLRELKPAEKLALRQSPELKPVIERIEAEKAAGNKVDTQGLLSKFKTA